MAVDADTAEQVTTAVEQDNDVTPDDVSSAGTAYRAADAGTTAQQRLSTMRWPIALALVVVLVLAGLFGWLGYRAYQNRQVEQQRDLFLQAGRQAALRYRAKIF